MIKLGNTSIIKVYKGDTEVIAAYKGVNLVYTKGQEEDYVDLGLPSGLLWAKGNLIKNGTTGEYAIEKETDWGTYISWGNIDGHNEGEGYNFDKTTYDGTPGASVAADIPSNDVAHDIALAKLGNPWHLPTKEDFQELYDNTDKEWVADYNNTGVAGRKFMKKSDHSVFVFFPASGFYNGTSLYSRGAYGLYWSASFNSATYAYYLSFDSSYVYPQSDNYRRYGFTVRPVTLPFAPLSLHFQDGSGVALAGLAVTVTDGNGAHSMTTDASGNIVMNVVKGNVTLSSDAYSLDITTINVSGNTSTVITGTEIDYSTRYLTFEAVESGTFSFTKDGLSYSTDGHTWTTLAANTNTPTIAAGQKIYFKGTMTPVSDSGIGTFSSTGNFTVSGTPMSLLFGDDFDGQTSLSRKGYAFYYLFSNCTKLTSIDDLSLPATTLAYQCYFYMFSGCTGLTSIPSTLLPATELASWCYTGMFSGCKRLTSIPTGLLPATTLASNCYQQMFSGCTKLTSIPSTLLPATTLKIYCYCDMFQGCTSLTSIPTNFLPATTLADNCYAHMFYGCTGLTSLPTGLLPATSLADYCYYQMFRGCTGLTTAPDLPATTLANNCYTSMFERCTGLTTAPDLPATTLASGCYMSMFYYCTSLKTAPDLPATTLVDFCYFCMFQMCTKLNYIKMLATDISATSCRSNWVYGVSATGTFVKASSMTTLPTGTSGIPYGWTVVEE